MSGRLMYSDERKTEDYKPGCMCTRILAQKTACTIPPVEKPVSHESTVYSFSLEEKIN
jgi:hypothetical protein